MQAKLDNNSQSLTIIKSTWEAVLEIQDGNRAPIIMTLFVNDPVMEAMISDALTGYHYSPRSFIIGLDDLTFPIEDIKQGNRDLDLAASLSDLNLLFQFGEYAPDHPITVNIACLADGQEFEDWGAISKSQDYIYGLTLYISLERLYQFAQDLLAIVKS